MKKIVITLFFLCASEILRSDAQSLKRPISFENMILFIGNVNCIIAQGVEESIEYFDGAEKKIYIHDSGIKKDKQKAIFSLENINANMSSTLLPRIKLTMKHPSRIIFINTTLHFEKLKPSTVFDLIPINSAIYISNKHLIVNQKPSSLKDKEACLEDFNRELFSQFSDHKHRFKKICFLNAYKNNFTGLYEIKIMPDNPPIKNFSR